MWNHEQLETVTHIPKGISLRVHKVGESIRLDATVFRDAESEPTHESGKKFVGRRLDQLQFVLAKLSRRQHEGPGTDLLQATQEIAYGKLSKDPDAPPVLRPFEGAFATALGPNQDIFRTSRVHPSEYNDSSMNAPIHETLGKAAENLRRASVPKTDAVFLPHEKDQMQKWIEHAFERELRGEHRHLAKGFARDIHRQIVESITRHFEND